MVAQAILNLFGLTVIPQLMDLGFINALNVALLAQRT
jgi:hypothetical protein